LLSNIKWSNENQFCFFRKYSVKIAGAENHTLKRVDECNLEHTKVQSKPWLLSQGQHKGLFDTNTGT